MSLSVLYKGEESEEEEEEVQGGFVSRNILASLKKTEHIYCDRQK